MDRYAVTGCAGFIGSHLVDCLLDRGAEVVGLDAFTNHYDRAIKEANIASARGRDNFTLHSVDLAVDPLEPLLRDVEGIFHLAAVPGVRESWSAFPAYVHNNVLASQRLFEAAAALGVRTVFASSSSVYGDAEALPVTESTPLEPISPYGVTKLACERLAAAYASQGLDAVVLRYFTVYGARQRPDMAAARLTSAACDGTTFVLNGTGEHSRDFTYIDDAVEATLTAMERAPAGAVYNVGGGEAASMNELIRLLGELCGRRLDVRLGALLPGDVKRTAADCGRIRRELGWAPRTALRDGLAAQLERRAAERLEERPRSDGRIATG